MICRSGSSRRSARRPPFRSDHTVPSPPTCGSARRARAGAGRRRGGAAHASTPPVALPGPTPPHRSYEPQHLRPQRTATLTKCIGGAAVPRRAEVARRCSPCWGRSFCSGLRFRPFLFRRISQRPQRGNPARRRPRMAGAADCARDEAGLRLDADRRSRPSCCSICCSAMGARIRCFHFRDPRLVSAVGAVAGGRSDRSGLIAGAGGRVLRYLPLQGLISLATLIFGVALLMFLARRKRSSPAPSASWPPNG